MIKKSPTRIPRCFLGQEGLILLGPTLVVFILLILLSFTLIRLIVNEQDEATNYVVETDARQIAMAGLERGIQQFRRTRVPPFFSQFPFGIGSYSIQFDTLKDETGTTLPWCNYVMIKSMGNVNYVERNVRIILSSLPHAFLFALYSQNVKGVQLDIKESTVSGDVYFNGIVKSTLPVTGTVYTSGDTALIGPVTFHPEPQPPFPYLDDSPFTVLLDIADGYPGGDIKVENSTLDLTGYADNTLYVRGKVEVKNSTVLGPGRIVATGEIIVNAGSTIGDGIMLVAKKKVRIEQFSTAGSGVCYPNDGVIIYAIDDVYIKESIVYGLAILIKNKDPKKAELEKSTFHGAFISLGKRLTAKESTVFGSLVTKVELKIDKTTITRGPLPLALSQDIGMEPYIIPGTWLEY